MPLFILTACNPFSKNRVKHSLAQNKIKTERLAMPVIPVAITDTDNRRAYLANHYWENMNVSTAYSVFSKEEIEQSFANYLSLLETVPAVEASAGLNGLMNRVVRKPALFRHFISLFEKYLYEPESPFKNEEWYITVLEYVVRSPKVDAVNKIRPQHQLQMLYKNRMGHIAQNFNYIDPAGKKGNLQSIRSKYTLLFFYDPDCEFCKATISRLKENKLLNDLQLVDKKLKVLAVYTEENSKLWLEHSGDIPAYWANVSDQRQITIHHQYDLKALPTLYLLDQDKKVLLKDVPLERIEDYFDN